VSGRICTATGPYPLHSRNCNHIGIADTTWLALDEDTLLGSVSLLSEDAPALAHLDGPWLASLWVHPAHRRQGLGAHLAWVHTSSTTSVSMRDSTNCPASVCLLLTVRTGTAVLAGKPSEPPH